MEHDEIKMQLANWIDTKNIANAIVEALEEEGAPVTLGNCKVAWEKFCCSLVDRMRIEAAIIALEFDEAHTVFLTDEKLGTYKIY